MPKTMRIKNISKVRVDKGPGNDTLSIICQMPLEEVRIEVPTRDFMALAAAITDARQKIATSTFDANNALADFLPDDAIHVVEEIEVGEDQTNGHMILKVSLNSGLVHHLLIPSADAKHYASMIQNAAMLVSATELQ